LAEQLETALKMTLRSLVMAADKFQTGENDARYERHADRGLGAAYEVWLQSRYCGAVLSQAKLFVFVGATRARQSLVDTGG
jgi:hypothetical protein